MAFEYTAAQQKVLDARDHNILVSAAAGSGKTAVLVERIVRLITEGEHPLDIDRLLVVTFTRAAAAQMRERIGRALAARLAEDPGNTHLQQQEVLLHNAQITTMDSFFTFLLRNYFSDIDLDPGFRQIDATESDLIAVQVMKDFLEEKYLQKDPEFLRCVEFFCPGEDDRQLEELILKLCSHADSHPSPAAWLKERAGDYDVPDENALLSRDWMRYQILRTAQLLLESDSQYEAMKAVCLEPGGPDICLPFFEEEQRGLFGELRALRGEIEKLSVPGNRSEEEKARDVETLRRIRGAVCRALQREFARYPATGAKKYAYMEKSLKEAAKSMRDREKERITKLRSQGIGQSTETILAMMASARGPVQTLAALAQEFSARFLEVKKEKHVIDFSDLEHFALEILAERQEDGTWLPRRAARALRSHYAEILIDEYQDSNEVQELLLQIISGEDDGKNNRFMVGDIKQSIYRFRLARPEIFMEKYDTYLPDDPQTERIELDQNFRSRREVLDFVNCLFMRIMRREVGGVAYNDEVSLKAGAVFPEEEIPMREEPAHDSPYRAEFLVLETEGADDEEEASGEQEKGPDEEEIPGALPELAAEVSSLTGRQKEALMIAQRIREMVGTLPVRDEETGVIRTARYGDIVILLRGTVGWNEDLRAVLAREGIPAYAESRTGYFAAQEIRTVIELLRVLDNPRQDIPLYGVLTGYYGGFSQDDTAMIRLALPGEMLYDALCEAAENRNGSVPDQLAERCGRFLEFLRSWRRKVQFCTVAEIVSGLLDETGYQEYCTALPAGTQRTANLRFLRSQADAFTRTDFTGLFQFLRYIDGLQRQEIDYGEANTIDENADVVRIMTIHKSKGLEFPICFIAGLSKAFSFRRFDTSGPMLFDSDWGVGIQHFDPVSRVRASTLRREEIAEKIRRDCMGEELRVLYVALTRAKEKLILTASFKDTDSKRKKWNASMAGFFHREGAFRLAPGMIVGASSFAELIMESILAEEGSDTELFPPENRENCPSGSSGERGISGEKGFPVRVRLYRPSDLTMHAAGEQVDLSRCERILSSMEGRPLDDQPDPDAARALAEMFFRVYPHAELQDLYAQTSVSELKHRAMDAALRALRETEEGAESPAELFPQEVPVPYLPSFAMGEEPRTEYGSVSEKSPLEYGAAGEESHPEYSDEGEESRQEHSAAGKASPRKYAAAEGARRGTAFHRILELMDYSLMDRFLIREKEEPSFLRGWILQQAEAGKISPEDAQLVSPARVLHFLQSPLAARMKRAEQENALFREQPFVMGIPADEISAIGTDSGGPRSSGSPDSEEPDPCGMVEDPSAKDQKKTGLHGEMVTVQGIIDAFFIEDGHIVLVDYKTDRVRGEEELALRYRTQLSLYAEALEKAYGLPVSEQIIYSTALGREVLL